MEKESKKRKKSGRPLKHGAYSIQLSDEIGRKHPRLRQYLEDTRAGLIRDVAGTEANLSEMQRLLIDRIINKLSICRLIEVYVEKYGIFNREALNKKTLALEPALSSSYLAFSNSIDRALNSLGLDRRKLDKAIDLHEYLKRTYGPNEERNEKEE